MAGQGQLWCWVQAISIAFFLVSGRVNGDETVRVCGHCGREIGATNEGVCRHCGENASVGNASARMTPEPEADRDWREAIREQTESAIKERQNGRHWAAWFFARNARALAAHPACESLRMTAAEEMKLARERLPIVDRACFACGGRGRRVLRYRTVDGNDQQIVSDGTPCPLCQGAGRLQGRRSREETSLVRNQSRRLFLERQRAEGWVAQGDVWVPPKLVRTLSIQNQAALACAAAEICMTCGGTGLHGCSACGGLGKRPCSNADCIMGTQTCPDCRGQGFANDLPKGRVRPITRACPTCRGKGLVSCRTCQGKAWVECARCQGKGVAVCAVCSGVGEPQPCDRCAGKGLASCSRCKGSGRWRDEVCTECHGAGVRLCAGCRGTGRVRTRVD